MGQHQWPLARIEVTGKDAKDFLQRQLTCDLNQGSGDVAQLGAWCDVKGRVIAVLGVNQGDPVSLILPHCIADSFSAGIARYVLRDDVQFHPPHRQTGVHATVSATRIALPGQPARYGEFGSDNDSSAADTDPWLMEVLAGIPWITQATQGKYLPQMLGLEALGGLSYRKGCYPGQEIIARAHFLGQVKRELAHGVLEQAKAQLPQPGDAVVDENGESAGEVLLVAENDAGGANLLLILRKVVLDDANRRLSIAESSLTVFRGNEPEQ